MAYTPKSETTSHSHGHAPHNCPSCHCSTPSASRLLPYRNQFSNILSQDYIPSSPPKSLYLSQQVDQLNSSPRGKGSTFRSQIFTGRMRVAPAALQSPSRTNITFSYSSPSRRKHHSSESHLTTKSFKQRHFPNLKVREQQKAFHNQTAVPNQRVLHNQKAVNYNEKGNPYYQIYTEQETPPRPKILKMNKAKSKNKLEITSPRKGSSKSIIKEPEIHLNNNPYNDYGLEHSKPVSISLLQQPQQQLKPGSVSRRQLLRNTSNTASITTHTHTPSITTHTHTHTPSIGYIQASQVNYKEPLKNSVLSHSQPYIHLENSHPASANSRNTSLRSLESYLEIDRKGQEQSVVLKGNQQSMERKETRIGMFQDRSMMESQQLDIREVNKEQWMAKTLSSQLQLNYDYYVPQSDSDKSLSMSINPN